MSNYLILLKCEDSADIFEILIMIYKFFHEEFKRVLVIYPPQINTIQWSKLKNIIEEVGRIQI